MRLGWLGAVLLASCGNSSPAGEVFQYDLVFGSQRSGGGDVYVLDITTGSCSAVSQDPAAEFNPRWDSVRNRLVYSRETERGVVSIGVDSSGQQVLGAMPGEEDPPDWSPTGEHCCFAKVVDSNYDVFVRDLATGEDRRLTTDPARDCQPRWSPDGAWIVFSSSRAGGADLWRIRSDGSELDRLTDRSSQEGHPSWSPDGRFLLFDAFGDGVSSDGLPDICVFDLQTREWRNLTDSPGMDVIAEWSPDGEWIAFGSNRSGNWDLYRVRSDGSDLERLTRDPAFDGDPKWVPRSFRFVR